MTAPLRTADGSTLHLRRWPGNAARGTLVVAHGIGEHSGCYDELARDLAARAGLVDVLAVDFRGHGLSPGRRGVIARYGQLVEDLRATIRLAAREHPGPVFLLGHSNGGVVALRLALGDDPGIDGLILSNPALRLAVRVPRRKLALGHLLRVFAPSVTLPAGLDSRQMTRDEASWSARTSDPLRHNRISPPLYFGMRAAGPEVLARAGEMTLPTLMLLGGSDPIIDVPAARAFFDRLGSTEKELRLDPEMRHEPLQELGRERMFEHVSRWLADRLDRRPPRHAAPPPSPSRVGPSQPGPVARPNPPSQR